MKQRLFLTLFSLLILLPFHSYAQDKVKNLDIDSLRKEISVLSKEKDKAEDLMMTYRAAGQFFVENKREKEALPFLEKGLKLARELQNEKEIYFFLYSLGLIYYYPLDDYSASLDYLLEAEEIGESFATNIQKANNQSRIANLYVSLGIYNKAMEYQLSSTRLSKEANDTLSLANGYRIHGNILWGEKAYDQALGYFERAHRLIKYHKEGKKKQFTYIASIGAAYVEMGDYEKGREKLEEALDEATKQNNFYGQGYAIGAIGDIYKNQKDYETAISKLNQAVAIFDSLGVKNEATGFRLEIADVYIELGDYEKANAILNQVDSTVNLVNSLILRKDYQEIKYKIYDAFGETNKAYEEYKKYIAIKDSLLDKERISQSAKLQQQDKVMQLEIEKEKANAETASQQKKLIFAGFIVFSILLAGVLYWARLRNKDLKESNQLLEAKTEEIKMQVERLASSNEELRQFAHVTSHDLREPLRSISSFTTLLKRRYKGKLDPEADEFINFITNGVKRMDTLLSDLLAYSVVGIGRSDYSRVNINEIIANILESLHREKATQGARISIQNLPELMANKKQMGQLFQHLIDNAIKFRSDEAPEIKVSCEDHEEGYMFSIADNGIGMDEAYKDKIFGLFLRLHHKKTKYKGTGIGLSICKKIVEQHKGRIWIESKIGKGTTVHFILPKSPFGPETVTTNTTAVNETVA